MEQIYLALRPTSSHGQRLNGPFGNEYVVGSYLSKLFFISLIYLILSRKKLFLFNFISFIYFSDNFTNKRKNGVTNANFYVWNFFNLFI